MQEMLHFIGVCPDSYQHISLIKGLMTGAGELVYAYQYLKHFLRWM